MTKLLVLYYSSYGHIETMAKAIAEGAQGVDGVQVDIRRVPETAPEAVVKNAGFKTDQEAPVIEGPDALGDYDGVVIGVPTRYGNMCSQMQAFWDQTGPLWQKGALIGKAGGAFTSTASQHGGQETTLRAVQTMQLHHGMAVIGVPYSCTGLVGVDEVSGGTPYGASTIADGDGSRQPSDNELGIARFQGEHFAKMAKKLAA